MYIIIKERVKYRFSIDFCHQTISNNIHLINSREINLNTIPIDIIIKQHQILFNLSEINLDTIPIDIYHQTTIIGEKQIILLVTFISNAQISSPFLSLLFILFYYPLK